MFLLWNFSVSVYPGDYCFSTVCGKGIEGKDICSDDNFLKVDFHPTWEISSLLFLQMAKKLPGFFHYLSYPKWEKKSLDIYLDSNLY